MARPNLVEKSDGEMRWTMSAHHFLKASSDILLLVRLKIFATESPQSHSATEVQASHHQNSWIKSPLLPIMGNKLFLLLMTSGTAQSSPSRIFLLKALTISGWARFPNLQEWTKYCQEMAVERRSFFCEE